MWIFSMGAVGAGALLLSAWLDTIFQPHHCRIKDWRYSLAAMEREGIQSTCLLGFLWVVTSPARTLVCLAQPAATPTNMSPLLAKRAMQGPTIQGASQRLHAISVMLGATADLGRQTAHCVISAAATLSKEAILHLPAFLVMLETTTLSKEALPVFPVMLEATAILGRQPAHRVMPGATIPPQEAQPAHCVILDITTLIQGPSSLPIAVPV